MDRTSIEQAVGAIPVWRHRIELPHGVVTPGNDDTAAEWARLCLPALLDGCEVLDVGCSDGYFSFECERRGAHVTAVDDESSLLAGDGRLNGFRTAAQILGSAVDYRTADVESLPDDTGRYDLILFLNVLYHLRNPMRALEELARVTAPGGTMVLKTHFRSDVRLWFRGRCVQFDVDRRPKWWYFPTTELGGDPTNWWSPNRPGLRAMLGATGWADVEHLGTWGDRIYLRARRT